MDREINARLFNHVYESCMFTYQNAWQANLEAKYAEAKINL